MIIKRIIDHDEKLMPEDILGFKVVKMKRHPKVSESVKQFLQEIEELKWKAGGIKYPAKIFNKYFLHQIWNENVKYNVEQTLYRDNDGDALKNVKQFAMMVLNEASLYDRATGAKKRNEDCKEPEGEPKDAAKKELKSQQTKKQPGPSNAAHIRCFNCGKDGHYQSDCTRVGGGAAPGSASKTKKDGEKSKTEQEADTAELESDSVMKKFTIKQYK
jgi:hypothetical protein